MYSVADVAKIFDVNGKTVKDWSYHFSEYLSEGANPAKGKQRFYSIEDIRIFAYVLLYWDENPDFENIKYGLNSEDYYEIEPINKLITELSPIFQEPTEEITNIGSNVIFAGMASLDGRLSIANAFKESGDILFETVKEQGNLHDFTSPILYQYRHAIELYLKSILIKPEKIHDLLKLYDKFETLIKTEFQTEVPSWLKEMILGFNKIDPGGDILRYGEEIATDEILIDLRQLKLKMSWFAKSVNNIYYKLEKNC